MLCNTLRNGWIELQELYIFFHCSFRNSIEKAVLGNGKVPLHQDPECSFKSWGLFKKGFLGFGSEGEKLTIFHCFNKDLARLIFIYAEGNIAHPCIFDSELQDDFKAIGIDKIFSDTAFDDESFKIAHFAFVEHNGLLRHFLIFQEGIKKSKFFF